MTELSSKRAVVLLSGGVDSTTAAAIALKEGYLVYGLSFNYGQRHSIELLSAAAVAKALELTEHRIINIDMRAIGGSALTADIDVPKNRSEKEISTDIPITYVPARNTIFLSFALAYAEVIGAFDIFIGVNAVDYSGYPDCRPDYIAAFEGMANLATKASTEGSHRFKIHTPLINLTKSEIIALGLDLGVDYSITLSCYDPHPDGSPCGKCDSCQIRQKAFAELGLADYST